MGGFFGVAAKESCTFDLFFGTDYHSHLGTRRAGMAVYGENGFSKSIQTIRLSPLNLGIVPVKVITGIFDLTAS